ncbi:hypothetical protein NL676_039303 [Syzygium grande]|nr:hypothetical protein NL676_039303 [Syzygium grande]
MAETLLSSLADPFPAIVDKPTLIMDSIQAGLASDMNKTAGQPTENTSSVLNGADRPLGWTQVNRKKGKGQLINAEAQTRLAPTRSVEENTGEKSASAPAPGPSLISSKTSNSELIRTTSLLPLDVNTGENLQQLRPVLNSPKDSAGPNKAYTAPDLPLEMNSGGVAPLATGLQPGHDQEALGDVLSYPEE